MIETDRLILRKFSEKDLPDLFEYLSDPEVVRFEPYRPMTLEEVREELDRRIVSDEMIAVELKSNHKLIGNASATNVAERFHNDLPRSHQVVRPAVFAAHI